MTDALVLESRGARVRRFAFPLPDALMALLYALAAAFEFLPGIHDELAFGLMIEGGFLLMQGTLVDIATRLKKRPPWWLIPIILGGVLLFTGGGAHEVLQFAWQLGMVVFIPLVISLLERGWILWHMPARTRIQKIAARALISNRIVTGLGCAALLLVVGLLTGQFFEPTGGRMFLGAGAIYFAIAAYDDLRVRGRRFAEKPRVLFRYDVLGIDYLAPL